MRDSEIWPLLIQSTARIRSTSLLVHRMRAEMRTSAIALLLLPAVLSACGSGGDPQPEAADAGIEVPDDGCGLLPERAWVVEGEELVVSILCQSGAALTDLSVGELPEGLIYDEVSQILRWTPRLDQAAVYHLALSAPSFGISTDLMIGVADAYDNPDNVAIVDPLLYTHELGLPVLFLASEPSNSEYEPMQVTYGGVTFEAEAKRRGKSSSNYPKKSYSLRFDKYSPFSETEFADFDNRTRVILTSTFDDNSYIRQRMAFDLWKRLEPSIAVEAYSAVVYHGTKYRGLYTVSDHINGELLKRSGLSKNGNLYKAENHDANFRTTSAGGSAKSTLHQGFSKTEGTPTEGQADAFLDLEELVAFVANSSDATFNAGIEARISIDDYAAWWLHATFALTTDSAGKNSYHYHDQARTWRVVPWDFNASFGQEWETSRLPADDNEKFFSHNRLFERLLAHPDIGPQIIARYRDLLDNGVFAASSLTALVDRYMDEIGLSAARDWERWQDQYYGFGRWSFRGDFTTHEEEAQYVRDWVVERSQFVRTSGNYFSGL